MPLDNLKFASLFSGCGGFDLGFLNRGFRGIAAYDQDPEAITNYSSNLGQFPIECDLRNGIPNEISLKEIDVLIAGPPCQGFSTIGKRIVTDERNHLLPLTGILASRIRPKVLVVENVAGALSGEHARYFSHLECIMRHTGYRTNTIQCQAADLGMSQLRKRILMFAWRTGREISFRLPRRPRGNLKTALRRVSGENNHHPHILIEGSKEWKIAQRISPGQKLSNVRGGSNAISTWEIPEVFGRVTQNEKTVLEMLRILRRRERIRSNGDADPVSLARLEIALGSRFHKIIESLILKGYLRRIDDGIDLVGTFNGKYRRLLWDKPACTVDTRFGSPRYFLHPSHNRGFSVREAARIQGFPDSYLFTGPRAAQYRIIGNAVPPPLGEVAAEISNFLLGMY